MIVYDILMAWQPTKHKTQIKHTMVMNDNHFQFLWHWGHVDSPEMSKLVIVAYVDKLYHWWSEVGSFYDTKNSYIGLTPNIYHLHCHLRTWEVWCKCGHHGSGAGVVQTLPPFTSPAQHCHFHCHWNHLKSSFSGGLTTLHDNCAS